MKNVLRMLLVCMLLLSVTACTNTNDMGTNAPPPESVPAGDSGTQAEPPEDEAAHVLIAYFSRMGNTEFPDGIDASTSASILLGKDNNLQGTTEYMASLIQENTGGDLHLIQTEEPYPADYDATVSQNYREQQAGIIPKLKNVSDNLDQYDIVFIGYPIWAMTIPQPIVSFLNQYDLSGKTVIPFCTHAGYGSGDSYNKIQSLCPEADVLEGFAVEAEEIQSAEQRVPQWLDELEIDGAS